MNDILKETIDMLEQRRYKELVEEIAQENAQAHEDSKEVGNSEEQSTRIRVYPVGIF